jgi:cytochrome c oxidase subunit IV
MAHESPKHHQPDHETYTGHAAPHHQAPLTAYFVVFGVLMVLTIITVAVSRVDFGNHTYNTLIAMAIAVAKAVVVILWFMHVIHSPRLTWIVVIASFLWLGVLFVLTFSDYWTRGLSLY